VDACRGTIETEAVRNLGIEDSLEGDVAILAVSLRLPRAFLTLDHFVADLVHLFLQGRAFGYDSQPRRFSGFLLLVDQPPFDAVRPVFLGTKVTDGPFLQLLETERDGKQRGGDVEGALGFGLGVHSGGISGLGASQRLT
jgi:hypothetical protein